MKKLGCIIVLFVISVTYLLFGFSKPNTIHLENNKPKKKIVYIQPLGDVKYDYLKLVKTSVESFYHFDCVINKSKPLTEDLMVNSKTRYSADKILEKFDSQENYLILTEKDIATPKGNIPEWGVLGLGYRPGTVCVVSTFRMKRNVNELVIKDRLIKVALHEIGHNLGLDHCDNDRHCMMNDAKGTIKQLDIEKIWLCDKCKKLINM